MSLVWLALGDFWDSAQTTLRLAGRMGFCHLPLYLPALGEVDHSIFLLGDFTVV